MKRFATYVALWLCVLLIAAVPALAEEVSSQPEVSGVSSEETGSSAAELEFTDYTPTLTLPKTEEKPLSAAGVIGWAAIFAAMLVVALFVYSARARDRRAFRTRSAARSRWQSRSPIHSGMSEKFHHDSSHTRR